MASNLFISYDLHEPGQNYEAVVAAIKQLGPCTRVHYSLWYVRSRMNAADVADYVWKVMDANDRLIVIDALGAAWHNLHAAVSEHMQAHWNQ